MALREPTQEDMDRFSNEVLAVVHRFIEEEDILVSEMNVRLVESEPVAGAEAGQAGLHYTVQIHTVAFNEDDRSSAHLN